MDEIKKKFKINEYIETALTHDEWYAQFDQWLESRNESFSGRLNGSVSSRRKSIFTEEFQKIIRDEVEKGRYDPATDPVMLDHKAKINKILKTYKI